MLVLLAGVLLLSPLLVFGQGHERTITKISWRSEPVKIVKLRTKGKPIEIGQKFTEEDDWLKGLTVTVENISNKLVSRIELSLSFPRPEGPSETIPTYTVALIYGRDPADTQDERQKQVVPHDTADVKMLDVNLPFIKTDLEQLGYPDRITHAEIRVDTVTFSDGSMWAGDEILYPEPTNPKQKFNPKFPLEKSKHIDDPVI
jgi:hypothetical protein